MTWQLSVRARPAPEAVHRLARTALGLAALSALWFAINVVHPVGPDALLWATFPAYGPLVTAIFWLTARWAPLPAEVRRMWRHLTPVPLLVAAGMGEQCLDVLRHPGVGGAHLTVPMLVLDGIAVLLVIHALGRLPLGVADRGAATRIVLDAGTVALATTLFIWHFSTRFTLGDASRPRELSSLLLMVMALLGVATATKVLFAGYAAIDSRGLRRLAATIFASALFPMLQPLLPVAGARLYMAEFHVPIAFTLGAYAALSQWRPARRPGTRPRRPRRPYSVLPYAAVAAVDALLLHVATGDHADLVVVAAGAVALTVLVAVRQSTALRDNARLLARLDHLATHDALTGLANRALVQRRLAEALSTGDRHPVSVALLDLDGFKQVNDTLGHEAGDVLLVAVAHRLAAAVRSGDMVARLGGDEFVIVLDGADRATASEIAERLVAALSTPVRLAGRDRPVRASIGIAGDRAGAEPGPLLRQADLAMYAAKKLAGTAYLHYAEPMAATAH